MSAPGAAVRRLRVPARFEGPPGFANGGYIAGLLAGEGPAQVTIRRPVPLETDLELAGGELREGGGDELLAEVVALDAVDVGGPPAVTLGAARAAAARTPLAEHHPFPGCFGCGPAHPTGIHCLPGEAQPGVWAVAWTPEETDLPLVWSALDCPSSAPVVRARGGAPHVLGRIAGHLRATVTPGEPHVVVAWALPGADDRRKPSASAVLDARGDVVAVARATWFALRS